MDCRNSGVHEMNSIHLSSISFILGLLLLILVTSPTGADMNTSLTCGVILPLSGNYEILGTEVLQGIECAAERINTSGGTEGVAITLSIADDMSDPDRASSLFEEMKDQGIPVIIGSLTTALTLPMAEKTRSDKPINTVLISPQANGNDLYGISPGFYQVLPPVFHLGEVIADWLSYTADRAALVYVDDSYGLSFRDTIKSGLRNSTRVVISAEVPITHDDPGFDRSVSTILDNVSDTVVIIGCDTESIPLIKALYESGFEGQMILTESCLMESLEADSINNTPGKFSLFTANAYTSLVPGRESEQFASEYQKKYRQNPAGSIAGYGYDSLMIIHEALLHERQTGNVTADTI